MKLIINYVVATPTYLSALSAAAKYGEVNNHAVVRTNSTHFLKGVRASTHQPRVYARVRVAALEEVRGVGAPELIHKCAES